MLRVLIIGSKGFIGSNLYENLTSSPDYDCWACDVVTDYTDPRYFLIDVSNSDFTDIFKAHKFEVCINCSGASSVPDSFIHPLRDYLLNVSLVAKILEGIRKYNNTCKFINLSSAAVYGNPQVLPVTEKAETKPLSPYGFNKLQAEQLAAQSYLFFNIPVAIIRIFSAYGPGLKKQIFWDVHQKVIQDEPLKFYGTGKESRDFIYVQDIIAAIKIIIKHADFKGEVYNVANGSQITMKDAIITMLSKMKINQPAEFMGETRTGDPLNWEADISLIKGFGFTPSFTFDQGIEKYTEWLRGL